MAKRPIFIPLRNKVENLFVKIDIIEFDWKRGMAKVNRQVSIKNLHGEIKKIYKNKKILEISSSSLNILGKKLSAFNLKLNPYKINKSLPNKEYSLESLFQGSKVFEFNEGPYQDIYDMESIKAKRDIRLKNKNIKGFQFFKEYWPNYPFTSFYDFLYINAVLQSKELSEQILEYDIFTDIHFNPIKSVNCQAYSAAFFVSLKTSNIISDKMNRDMFFKVIDGINYTSETFAKNIKEPLF